MEVLVGAVAAFAAGFGIGYAARALLSRFRRPRRRRAAWFDASHLRAVRFSRTDTAGQVRMRARRLLSRQTETARPPAP